MPTLLDVSTITKIQKHFPPQKERLGTLALLLEGKKVGDCCLSPSDISQQLFWDAKKE
jgi:hypothetical protein